MATRKVIRGDSDSFKLTFKAKAYKKGKEITIPIDITGWEIRFTVRKSLPATSVNNDKDAVIHKVADIIDGPNGVAYISVSSTDTNIEPGEYWYDIQCIRPACCTGDLITKSIPRGRYIVISDITRNRNYY